MDQKPVEQTSNESIETSTRSRLFSIFPSSKTKTVSVSNGLAASETDRIKSSSDASKLSIGDPGSIATPLFTMNVINSRTALNLESQKPVQSRGISALLRKKSHLSSVVTDCSMESPENDLDDFSEWYIQLMTNASNPLPFAPSSTSESNINDKTIPCITWSAKTLFVERGQATWCLLDQASQYTFKNRDEIIKSSNSTATLKGTKPPPIFTTPFKDIEPLNLSQVSGDTTVINQMIIEILTFGGSQASSGSLLSSSSFEQSCSRQGSERKSPIRPIRGSLKDLDDNAVCSFLALLRLYISPMKVLRTLMHVFEDPTNRLNKYHVKVDRATVQRNIEKILRVWINIFWADFGMAQGAIDGFSQWVLELEKGPKSGITNDDGGVYHMASMSLLPLIKSRKTSEIFGKLAQSLSGHNVLSSENKVSVQATKQANPAQNSTSESVNTVIEPLTNEKSLDQVPNGSLASHLVQADRYFASILSVPLIDLAARIGIPQTYAPVQNLIDYFAYTTGLFRWVLHSIDATTMKRTRVNVVKRMIKLINSLVDLGSLNAACTIAGALSCPWVIFQHSVWESISFKYIAMMRTILDLVDPTDAYSGYQRLIGSRNVKDSTQLYSSKLPFIAMHIFLASKTEIGNKSQWQSLYLPPVKVLLEIQGVTGSTHASPQPDPNLIAILQNSPQFDLVKAWTRDIKLGSQTDIAEYIEKYRGLSQLNSSSRLLKSLSGSVATLLGSSAKRPVASYQSQNALITIPTPILDQESDPTSPDSLFVYGVGNSGSRQGTLKSLGPSPTEVDTIKKSGTVV